MKRQVQAGSLLLPPPLPPLLLPSRARHPAAARRVLAGKLTWVLDSGSASALHIDDWAKGSKAFPRSENPPKPAAA